MKTIHYNTTGTCSKAIEIDIADDGTICDVHFLGGCKGNLQGITALVKGLTVDQVIARLDGICCGAKGTSCPDQLAKALKSQAYND